MDGVGENGLLFNIGNPSEQGNEDDICTVIEGQNNAGKIPQLKKNILNQDVSPVFSPPCSSRNSKGSSS